MSYRISISKHLRQDKCASRRRLRIDIHADKLELRSRLEAENGLMAMEVMLARYHRIQYHYLAEFQLF